MILKIKKSLNSLVVHRILISVLSIFVFTNVHKLHSTKQRIRKLEDTTKVLSLVSESNRTTIRRDIRKTVVGFQNVRKGLYQLHNNQYDLGKTLVKSITEHKKLVREVDAKNRVAFKVFEYIFANTSLSFPRLIKKTLPAVVSILPISNRVDQITGTGFIIDKEKGYILTANHVVLGIVNRAKQPSFVLFGKRVLISEICFSLAEDVALIVADVHDPNYLPTAEIKLSNTEPRKGELILLLGHPYGLINSTFFGIVSVLDVESLLNGTSCLQYSVTSFPGTSGGPVINMHGEVIALHTEGTINSGIGFGVPSRIVSVIAAEFIEQVEK